MKKSTVVFFALLGIMLSNAAIARGQEITPIDRKNLLPCSSESLAKYADDKTAHFWDVDNAGVSPMNRAILKSKSKEVTEYFLGVQVGKKYTAEERVILAEARIGNEGAIIRQAYTPSGTKDDDVMQQLPDDEYNKVILPATLKFTEVNLPCGFRFDTGVSFGKEVMVNGEKRLRVGSSPWNFILAWSERGVKTKDGKPGIRALQSDVFTPTVGPNAGVPMRVMVIRNCGNDAVVREQTQIHVEAPAAPLVVDTSNGTITRKPTPDELNPRKPAPPAPPAPTPKVKEPRPEGWKPKYTPVANLGYQFGTNHSDYSSPCANCGDVPQKHNFGRMVATFGVEPTGNGVFGFASGSALGADSSSLFQDITGAWVKKIRDSDTSRDTSVKAVVGYQQKISDNLRVGGFGGWSRTNLEDNYVAQGATSNGLRSYTGPIVGVRLMGSKDRLSVGVTGEFGLGLTRTASFHQTYPGVTFAPVVRPDESAKSYGIRAELGMKVYKALHANIAYDYLGLSSTRPTTYTAHENVTVNALTIGVSIKWAR